MHDTQVECQNLLMFSLMAANDPSVNMIAFASGKEQAREAFNEITFQKNDCFHIRISRKSRFSQILMF